MSDHSHVNGTPPGPAVSVILPVYNGAASLDRAVTSVRGQSFPHWELLAIDDGSDDGSFDRLKKLAASDRRIRLFQSAENRGSAAARNLALGQARGEFVAYLDCLDEYLPNYLEHVRNWPKDADVCVFCYELIGDESATEPRRLAWDPVLVCERIAEANIACPLAMAHRRGLLDRTGTFEECFRREEDWDLWKRFARSGASFLFLPAMSGRYHVRPGSRTGTRRLADLAWQANGAHISDSTARPPRLVRYTGPAGESTRAAADQAEALFARGTTLAQEGRRVEAIALFQQALRLKPDHAKAHHNLGVALAEEKKISDAMGAFRDALRCQPSYPEAHYCLGNSLVELGRVEEAVAAFREAIRQKPDFVDAHNNLGLALSRAGRQGEAAIYLRQAARLQPDMQKAHNNLGLAYLERGDFAAAESCFDEALRLNPRYPDPHTNLGSVYKEQGRLEEAIACYDLALNFDPEAVTPRWNRSLALLQMGNFEEGWVEYEWRWKRKESTPRSFTQPRWDGAALEGKTIFLHVEQGLGDMLQFIRYAGLVKERGGTVMVAAPPALVALFATCPGVDKVVPENQQLPPFDVHAPLMSLPILFETTVTTIPARVPYLAAEPAKVEHWRQRLSDVPGFKVGIAWQGNPRHKWDRFRSFPLSLLEPIGRIEGVSLLSLQKGPGAEQVPFLGGRFSVLALGPELGEFSDTAALMQCLDLMICCDTSLAHLAGALGVQVWVAMATIADWRWLLHREDSPWYPTMRLFRQEQIGEWKPVIRRLAEELEREIRGKRVRSESEERVIEIR